MSSLVDKISLERMVAATDNVRIRLLRVTAALDGAGIPYAVAGGNAVAAYVSAVDEAAVRNTQDVDILISRGDLDRVRKALEPLGFVYHHATGLDIFIDGATGKPRDAVHVVFANEFVRPEEPVPNPDVSASERSRYFRVLSLQALVQIKLTAFRDKDRVHLRDLIDVGLIDATWPARFPAALGARLQMLLDTPGR